MSRYFVSILPPSISWQSVRWLLHGYMVLCLGTSAIILIVGWLLHCEGGCKSLSPCVVPSTDYSSRLLAVVCIYHISNRPTFIAPGQSHQAGLLGFCLLRAIRHGFVCWLQLLDCDCWMVIALSVSCCKSLSRCSQHRLFIHSLLTDLTETGDVNTPLLVNRFSLCVCDLWMHVCELHKCLGV